MLFRGKTKAATSATPKASATQPSHDVVFELIKSLRELSQSAPKCTLAIQKISQMECLTKISEDGSTPPKCGDFGANQIIIATHIINRLLPISTPSTPPNLNINVAIVMTVITSYLGQVLMSDKTQLERNMNLSFSFARASHESGMDPKSVLGRALMSCTVGAITTMHVCSEHYIGEDDGKFHDIMRRILWTNLVTLERILSVKKVSSSNTNKSGNKSFLTSKSSPNLFLGSSSHAHTLPIEQQRLDTWNIVVDSLTSDLDLYSCFVKGKGRGSRKEGVVQKACAEVSKALFEGKREEYSVFSRLTQAIFENDTTSPPPKRVRRSTKTESSQTISSNTRSSRSKANKSPDVKGASTLSQDFVSRACQLLFSNPEYPFNETKLEGRVTVKKWISVIFIWICQGETKLLDVTTTLLSNNTPSFWTNVMEHQSHSLNIKSSGKALSHVKGRTRSGKVHLETSPPMSCHVPGNVALVTFASHIVGLLYESAKLCASTQPGDGVKTYAELIMSIQDLKSLSPIESKTSKLISSPTVAAVKGKSSMSFGVRPVIRDQVITVMQLLLKMHQNCLVRNVAIPVLQSSTLKDEVSKSNAIYPIDTNEGVVAHIVINEDERSSIIKNSAHFESDLSQSSKFHPQLHNTISFLSKCSAWGKDKTDAAEEENMLMAVGSALSLKYGLATCKTDNENASQRRRVEERFDTVEIVDAKLCSMAMCTLTESIGNPLTQLKQSRTGDGFESRKKEVKDDRFVLSSSLVQKFDLDQSIDTLYLSKDGTLNQKSPFEKILSGLKSSKASNREMDDVGSSSAILPKVKTEEEYTHNGNGETFALFLRAVLPDGEGSKHENGKSSPLLLTKALFRIIRCCYSIPMLSAETVTR